MVDLQTIKNFLKVDNDEDDALISLLMSTAQKYMLEYGIDFDEENPVHQLLILNLIGHFYENRANPSEDVSFTIKALLQHCGLTTPSAYSPTESASV